MESSLLALDRLATSSPVRPEVDDWALVRAGDDAALTVVFARHKDFVYRLAWGFTGDAGLAEDVTQEVFLRMFERHGRWRRRAKFRTLLYRITANTARELVRRRDRGSVADDARTTSATQVEPRPVGELADLSVALAGLPARQREVVVLRHLEGLSTRETATALGCRPGTVKAHLHRAFAALRRILDPVDLTTQSSETAPVPDAD